MRCKYYKRKKVPDENPRWHFTILPLKLKRNEKIMKMMPKSAGFPPPGWERRGVESHINELIGLNWRAITSEKRAETQVKAETQEYGNKDSTRRPWIDSAQGHSIFIPRMVLYLRWMRPRDGVVEWHLRWSSYSVGFHLDWVFGVFLSLTMGVGILMGLSVTNIWDDVECRTAFSWTELLAHKLEWLPSWRRRLESNGGFKSAITGMLNE